ERCSLTALSPSDGNIPRLLLPVHGLYLALAQNPPPSRHSVIRVAGPFAATRDDQRLNFRLRSRSFGLLATAFAVSGDIRPSRSVVATSASKLWEPCSWVAASSAAERPRKRLGSRMHS